jgi:DNA polymerase (family 10)
MDKRGAAHLLDTIATYLELKGENPFKVRAFGNAARAVETLPGDLDAALASGALEDAKGIGRATLEVVREYARTGRAALLEELQREVPPGLVDMRRISGLGAAKIRVLHERLRITTVAELELAARNGRLAGTPGFGGKTAERILRGIEFLHRTTGFRLSHHAARSAEQLRAAVAALPGVAAVEVAGSVRRRLEIVRDVDLVAAATIPAGELGERLRAARPGLEVRETGEGLALRLDDGTPADLFCVAPERLGHALVWATGSVAHLELLAAQAASRGLRLGVEGATRDGAPVACPDEAALYAALGLPWIPPELREGGEEVARAAAGTLPRLVERDDLRGLLHCHSTYSDGAAAVADLAAAARAAGYSYLGLTDHSMAAAYAGGLKEDDVRRQHAEIDELNRQWDDFRVLKGIEADILADGALDYRPEVLDRFDFVVGSIHSRMELDEATQTARVLRALDDPHLTILGHPTGRLLLGRGPVALDLGAVIAKAAERGVAIEINGDPQRLDLDWRRCREARDAGATLSIGSDAHSVAGLENMERGLAIARKGWLERADVLNTRDTEEFLHHARRRQ